MLNYKALLYRYLIATIKIDNGYTIS
jgi:hypothetical protein